MREKVENVYLLANVTEILLVKNAQEKVISNVALISRVHQMKVHL